MLVGRKDTAGGPEVPCHQLLAVPLLGSPPAGHLNALLATMMQGLQSRGDHTPPLWRGGVGNVWRCFGGHTLGACASWLWWAETTDGAHHLTTHNANPTVPRAIPATPRAMPTEFRAIPTTPSTVPAVDTHQPPPHISRAGVRTLTGDLAAGSVRCLRCRRPGER